MSAKIPTFGSKLQVHRGNAMKTSGGLTKDMLMVNKRGKVVSRKQHELGKLAFARNRLQPKSGAELAALRKK